jgi:hypothetical protein
VRTPRADGTRSQQIDYTGDTRLRRNKTEVSSFFEGEWTPTNRLTLEYGVRFDRDPVASENSFAPRLARNARTTASRGRTARFSSSPPRTRAACP